MRVLIVSDSHGNDGIVLDVIDQENPDIVLHAGDSETNYMAFCRQAGVPIYMVSGNCDFRSDLPGYLVVTLAGHNIFLTHGHLFGAWEGYYEDLREAASSMDCEMVVFGHIHVPVYDEEDGILVLNPGSISRPRQPGRRKSYMMMELEDGKEPYAWVKYIE